MNLVYKSITINRANISNLKKYCERIQKSEIMIKMNKNCVGTLRKQKNKGQEKNIGAFGEKYWE